MKLETVLFFILFVYDCAMAKTATLVIDKSTGDIEVSVSGGETVHFKKALDVPLGDAELLEDPDTFRGVAEQGLSMVSVRFTDGKNGKRQIDQNGILHLIGKVYSLNKVAGQVNEDEEKIEVKVTLGSIKTPGNDVVKPPKGKQGEEKKSNPKHSIVKRATGSHITELGVFFDKGFYDQYVTTYGAAQAESKIQSFWQTALSAMTADYATVNIGLSVKVFEIFKTAKGLSQEEKVGGSVGTYLSDLVKSNYNAPKKTVDHSMLFSGYKLLSSSTLGIAYVGTLCNYAEYAASVMNSFDMPSIGVVTTHELGHSFGVYHDGSTDTAATFEKNCGNSNFIMRAWVALGDSSDKTWSSCSKLRIADSIAKFDTNNINCLLTVQTSCYNSDQNFCTTNDISTTGINSWACDVPQYSQYCLKACNKCTA